MSYTFAQLPRGQVWGPNVVADNGCWYPWWQIPPYWGPPWGFLPPTGYQDQPPAPSGFQDPPPSPSGFQDQGPPPQSSMQPVPTSPVDNPDTSFLAGQKDGRRNVWQPRGNRASYRQGWKFGARQRRFRSVNPGQSRGRITTSTLRTPYG